MINGNNRVCQLLNISVPIIQGGMVWCSGWRLAAAVSNTGGLGLIGSGSMTPEILREHIHKTKVATKKPFGVNVPLLYPSVEQIMEVILEEDIKIVFTSAGNPNTWTAILKSKGVKVVHVVSSLKFAQKAEQAGVDAIVAEGFEAGGHNGRDETTTMVLIPLLKRHVDIPLIAAGGIATGRAMLAAQALGADAVQIGSRFATSLESSSHMAFKQVVIDSTEGDTVLTLKRISPVRMLKNKFFEQIKAAEERGTTNEELLKLLGKGRSRKGIFEGDLQSGELEIGQVACQLDKIQSVAEIMTEILSDYAMVKRGLFNNEIT